MLGYYISIYKNFATTVHLLENTFKESFYFMGVFCFFLTFMTVLNINVGMEVADAEENYPNLAFIFRQFLYVVKQSVGELD